MHDNLFLKNRNYADGVNMRVYLTAEELAEYERRRNEISVQVLSCSANSMTRKIQIFENSGLDLVKIVKSGKGTS